MSPKKMLGYDALWYSLHFHFSKLICSYYLEFSKSFVAIYPNFPCKTRDILKINLLSGIPQQIRTYFLCAVLFSIEYRNRLKNSLIDGCCLPCQWLNTHTHSHILSAASIKRQIFVKCISLKTWLTNVIPTDLSFFRISYVNECGCFLALLKLSSTCKFLLKTKTIRSVFLYSVFDFVWLLFRVGVRA